MYMLWYHSLDDKARGCSVIKRLQFAERDGEMLKISLSGESEHKRMHLNQFACIVASSDADMFVHYYRTKEDAKNKQEAVDCIYCVKNSTTEAPELSFQRTDGAKVSIPFNQLISVTTETQKEAT